jgi:DNA polymerase-3 subunit alpha
MRISNVLAGFTLGEADLLRKAMGKKKADVMAAMREKFVSGARGNGINERKAAHVFDLMEHFAGYGFNKSHSTAYALLAYQTAYLKANYPWHFAAALLTIEAQNTDKLALYLGECRERGIPVLPPDVNESEMRFIVTPNGVRFGLTAIKNVGEGAIQSLIDVRTLQGSIASLHALCEELDLRLVNKRVFESLVKAGAFDAVGRLDLSLAGLPTTALRPRMIAGIDEACEYGTRHQRDKLEGQAQLFGAVDVEANGSLTGPRPLPEAVPWTETEQLAFEKETLGLYWSGHPVDRYARELKTLGARTIGELADLPASSSRGSAWGAGGPKPIEPDTSIGGVVTACRQLKTRKGDRMAVFTLEDAQGAVEVIAFPEAYQRAASLIESGTMLLVRGKLEHDDDSTRLLASEIAPLDSVHERVAREVSIRVKLPADEQVLRALDEIFSRHRGDRRVSFEIELPAESAGPRVRADLSSQVRVRPSSSLVAEVERVTGLGTVTFR